MIFLNPHPMFHLFHTSEPLEPTDDPTEEPIPEGKLAVTTEGLNGWGLAFSADYSQFLLFVVKLANLFNVYCFRRKYC